MHLIKKAWKKDATNTKGILLYMLIFLYQKCKRTFREFSQEITELIKNQEKELEYLKHTYLPAIPQV